MKTLKRKLNRFMKFYHFDAYEFRLWKSKDTNEWHSGELLFWDLVNSKCSLYSGEHIPCKMRDIWENLEQGCWNLQPEKGKMIKIKGAKNNRARAIVKRLKSLGYV